MTINGLSQALIGMAITAWATAPGLAQPASSRITAEELGARLRFFSSDGFEGRAPGTRGETLATSYLISELTSFGVKPGMPDGTWRQSLTVLVHDADPESPNEASVSGRVTRTLEHGRDIRLTNHGSDGAVETGGELVFVGYGIDAPAYRWNDLDGLDLRGKVAVALLGEPAPAGDTTLFNGQRASRYSWARDRQEVMGRRGAVAVLWLRPAGTLSHSPVTGSRRLEAGAARPGLMFAGNLTDSAFASLLPPGAGTLAAVLAAAGQPGFRSIPLGARLDVRFRTRPRRVVTHNVVGVVPGTVAGLRDEHVVLSAHWDAYGIVPPVAGDSIANGAMDDGSGVTSLLALARVFSAAPEPRSLSFLFTTAEEWGLLGAEAFACRGPLPADRMVANLNLDDGLELFGKKRDVAPLGIELSSLGATVATVARRHRLAVSVDPFPAEGFFLRADNFPFARIGVPALYLALGTDDVGRPRGWTDGRAKDYMDHHYHRPSDEYDRVVVDLAGVVQLAEFTQDVTSAVARAPTRPTWNRGAEFSRASGLGDGNGCP